MSAFPSRPLDITVEAAFGADLTAAPDTWAWTTLTCPHPTNAGQTIGRATADPLTINQTTTVGALNSSGGTSVANITLLNHDGALTPGNPTSPYYPYLDEGVPVRISIVDRDTFTDTFTRTVTGGWGTAPDGTTWALTGGSANHAVNGTVATTNITAVNVLRQFTPGSIVLRDSDIVYDHAWPQTPTGNEAGVAPIVRRTDSNNYLRAGTHVAPGGAVKAVLSHASGGLVADLNSVTIPGLTYTPNLMLRTRVRVEGSRLRMRVWPAAGVEPGVWHVDNTAIPETVPSQILFQAFLFAGNTNTLPCTLSVDNVTVAPVASVRAQMYITDIQPAFQPLTGGTTWSTVVLSLGGVGSRLEKRESVSQSPMRRSVQQAPVPPYAYWPLEDAQGSTSAASAFPGGPRMQLTGPGVFGFDGGTPADEYLTRYGTKPIVSLAAGAKLTVAVPTAPVVDEWAISWVCQSFSLGIPKAELRLAAWETPGGEYDRWALQSYNSGYQLLGYSRSTGVTMTYIFVTSAFGVYKEQVTFTVEAQNIASNASVELFVNDASLGSLLFAGRITPITRVTLNPDAINTTASVDPYGIKLLYGHLRVVQETFTSDTPHYTVPETGRLVSAVYAWTQEPAHRRVSRLCSEERVQILIDGTPGLTGSTFLGAQRDDTFSPLLAAAVEAESGALLHEHAFGYRMLPRASRYNRPVALTVDLSTYARSGDTEAEQVLVPQLLSRAANYWTISRTGGSEGTFAAPADYRLRHGTVTDERTLDLLADDSLPDHAEFRTHLNVDDRTTGYPKLPLDLTANPGLLEAYKPLLIGDRVQRVNPPTIAGYEPIDQVVEGISETITPTSWVAELDVAPASVWQVGVYDDPSTRRDSASTTLGVARTSSQTSWTFSTASKADVWDTAAVPYDVACGGETVTVTSMGAVTGTGPYLQTATVTRSVNGVVKAQKAGDRIRLAKPTYRAL